MRRIISILSILVILAPAALMCLHPALADTPDYADDTAYSNFAGRLYIPAVGIDVALYRSNAQYVVDRVDSAAYFEYKVQGHYSVADHWTQGFATLKDVEVGMTGYIVRPDGRVDNYVCTDVFDGHNTGHGITDNSGKFVHHRAPLLMYTCLGYWRNVRICLWEEAANDQGK